MQLKSQARQKTKAPKLFQKIKEANKIGLGEDAPDGLGAMATTPESFALPCLLTIRESDAASGVHFRDCLVDYTTCPERRCIRKLV